MTAEHSFKWMDPDSNQSPTIGHSGCFLVFSIMDKATQIFMSMFLCVHKFWVNTKEHNCQIIWQFYDWLLEEPPNYFPRLAHHFTFSSAMGVGYNFSKDIFFSWISAINGHTPRVCALHISHFWESRCSQCSSARVRAPLYQQTMAGGTGIMRHRRAHKGEVLYEANSQPRRSVQYSVPSFLRWGYYYLILHTCED